MATGQLTSVHLPTLLPARSFVDPRDLKAGHVVSDRNGWEVELFVTDSFDHTFRHVATIGAKGANDGAPHVVAFIVDGGSKVVSVVVDDHLDDGGEQAPQGWAVMPSGLGEIGGSRVRFQPAGRLMRLSLFDRALLTSEAIGAARETISRLASECPL